MVEQLERLRRAFDAEERGSGREFPAALRAEAASCAVQLRSEGWTWQRIADALGVSPRSLRTWIGLWPTGERVRSKVSVSLLPVRVERGGAKPVILEPKTPRRGDFTGSELSVVTPGGYRLEGLRLHDAMAVLRELP